MQFYRVILAPRRIQLACMLFKGSVERSRVVCSEPSYRRLESCHEPCMCQACDWSILLLACAASRTASGVGFGLDMATTVSRCWVKSISCYLTDDSRLTVNDIMNLRTLGWTELLRLNWSP